MLATPTKATVRQGGVLPGGALECLVLVLGAVQHRRVQVAQQRDEVLDLGGPQHLVEQQVVDVQQRVAGDKDGHVGVAGLFIDGKELLFDAGADDKAVPGQPLALIVRQGKGDPDVAQVGGDRLVLDGGHDLDGRLLKGGKDQVGARQGGGGGLDGSRGEGWSGGGSTGVAVERAVGSIRVAVGDGVAVGSVLAVGVAAPQAASSRDRTINRLNDRVDICFIALYLLNTTAN